MAVRRRCNFPSSRGLIGWRSIDERGDRGENAAAAGVSCRRRRGDAGPWKEEEAEAEEEEEDAREGAPGRGLRGELGMFFLRSREILLCNKSELNVKRQDAKTQVPDHHVVLRKCLSLFYSCFLWDQTHCDLTHFRHDMFVFMKQLNSQILFPDASATGVLYVILWI